MLTFWQEFSHHLLEELKKLLPGQTDLRNGIMEALYYGPRYEFDLFGQHVRLSDTAISMWISVVALILIGVWIRRGIQLMPNRRQTFVEMVLASIVKTGRESGMTEAQARSVVPYVATVGALIVLSNLASVFEVKPPAQNPIFAITLAFLSLGYIIFKGIRLVGLRGFWDSLVHPMPALLPFKLLDYLIKPISLAFRLFGNIFGAYVLMKFVALVIPAFLPPILGLWFDIGDGIVQGVVFAYLTVTYLGEIVEGAHEAKEARLAKAKLAEAARR